MPLQLTVIQSPANPNRLWIVDVNDRSQSYDGSSDVYEYQMTRPLVLTGNDPDHLLIASLKAFVNGKELGFKSWQEFAQYLEAIPDVEAAAKKHKTTIQTLVHNIR